MWGMLLFAAVVAGLPSDDIPSGHPTAPHHRSKTPQNYKDFPEGPLSPREGHPPKPPPPQKIPPDQRAPLPDEMVPKEQLVVPLTPAERLPPPVPEASEPLPIRPTERLPQRPAQLPPPPLPPQNPLPETWKDHEAQPRSPSEKHPKKIPPQKKYPSEKRATLPDEWVPKDQYSPPLP